ncbi:hypothetical protein QJQ45_013299 [Haematococcus lacustris]|nr:hypothetical protein QJQ45_013299 [Haematococcus lacustris]
MSGVAAHIKLQQMTHFDARVMVNKAVFNQLRGDATQIGVGIDPGVTQAVSAASGVWDTVTGQLVADQLRRWKLSKGLVRHASGLNDSRRDTQRWLALIKPHLQHLAAASSSGTSVEANLKHITVTLATWDAVWEVYLDPKWARQRLRLYGAQDRALEQFFKKLEEDMAEVSMEHHGRAKQLVVFFGAAGIGTGGARATDQQRVRVVLVDEPCTTRVSSAVNGQQPCEEELDHEQPTRRAGWKPPAGQVEHRLLRPAWSQQRDQPVRSLMWCPVVALRKPPQAPCSSQAATQPAASEPGSSTPLPAKRSKRTEAEPAAQPTQPTKGEGKGKGKAAKAKPAPQPGRWLDRDCNAALNMQRIGESRWCPLELCWWPEQAALPAKGKEYPGLRYKRLRDKPPKAQQPPPHLSCHQLSISACCSCQLYTIALTVWARGARSSVQHNISRTMELSESLQRWFSSAQRVSLTFIDPAHLDGEERTESISVHVYEPEDPSEADACITFLHGYPSCRQVPGNQASARHRIALRTAREFLLTLRARLLLVDMLGYGDSDKGVGEARFSISQQANVVQAVWARFNVKRTHLVVHDFAVSVAQELLSKQPKGRLPIPIHKVFWLNGSVFTDLYRPTELQQRLMADMTGWLTARSLTQSAFEQVVGGVFSREHPPPRQVRFIKDRHRYKHIWQGALELAMRFDSSRMMFFWGAQDPMSGAHVAEELKRRFGRYNVQISVHADLGHWPHIEDPARVAQALTAFVAEPWTPVWPVVAESGSATSPTMEKGSSVSVHNGSVHYPEGKSGHRRQSMALERNSKIPGSALDRTSGIPRTVQRSNSATDENTFVQKPCPSPSASTTMLNAVNAAAKLEVEAVPAIV